MLHLFRRFNLSSFDRNEQVKAINFLRYGSGARDQNGFPFAMTIGQAESTLRRTMGIFWRYLV